jgi:hypothetical protein
MKELCKENIVRDLRREIADRKLRARDICGEKSNFFSSSPEARWPGDKKAVGWITILSVARKLGYRIEYRLVTNAPAER